MRKITLILMLLPLLAVSQGKPSLQRTIQIYKKMTTIRANISLLLENQKEKTSEIHKGNVVVKGKKFRVKLMGQELFCDGNLLTTYNEEVNEAQVDQYKPEPNDINPSNIFTVYETGFNTAFIEESGPAVKRLQVFDLVPTDKKRNFFKIRLSVDKKTGEIVSGKVFQKNGTLMTYTILKLGGTPEASDKEFSFDKKMHPGVEVIDMR